VCESDTGASAPARDARGRIDLEIAGLRVATGGWVPDRRCGWAGRLRGSAPVDHARPGQRPLSRSGLSVGFSSVRVSGGHPSLRPPVVHRARTAEGLSGLYRESCAIVWRHYRRPLTVARRRAGARQLAPAGPARVRRGGRDELQRLPARGAAAQRGAAVGAPAADRAPGGAGGRLSPAGAFRQGVPAPVRRHARAVSRARAPPHRAARRQHRSRRTLTMRAGRGGASTRWAAVAITLEPGRPGRRRRRQRAASMANAGGQRPRRALGIRYPPRARRAGQIARRATNRSQQP
jgi:hypothetical protein